MATKLIAPSDVRYRVAHRLADYQVLKGPGEIGTLSIGLEKTVLRQFKAHWTGFKLAFLKPTMVLTATLDSGEYWSEAYVSIHQPSWILAFRRDPHKARGSGGPRPDDKLSLDSAVEISLAQRHALIAAGNLPHEELIRMEDVDDPLEAVDQFFNYTAWYVLRAIEASWDKLGYVPDVTIGWGVEEDRLAALPPGSFKEQERPEPPPPTVAPEPVATRRSRRADARAAARAARASAAAARAPKPATPAAPVPLPVQLSRADEVRYRVAGRLADYRVQKGIGEIGTLHIGLERNIVRTFKAHWTGFKLTFPRPTLFLTATLNSGEYWSEGYISIHQPSWVLSFRRDPHPDRGSGGPRPDDKLSPERAIETSLAYRHALIDAGHLPHEELIRMEDFDDPLEAVDEFFNYTTWYVLRAIDTSWHQLSYSPDTTIGWGPEEDALASEPPATGIDEGLSRSHTIWLTPDTSGVTMPASLFLYRPGKIYVVASEEQRIPDPRNIQQVQVAVRWKGRDHRLVDFNAAARVVGRDEQPGFEEIARLILAERPQAERSKAPGTARGVVLGSTEETVHRWLDSAVILELTPDL
ncbi:MAG: hypothetical protein ACRDJU_04795 [Actinomycetota bacterium]